MPRALPFPGPVLGLFLLLALPHPPAGAAVPDPERRAEAARAAIFAGLELVPAPGLPGRLAVFGPDALALFAPERDGAPRVVIGAAHTGGHGRLVAFGHTGYLDPGMLGSAPGRDLLRGALAWAAEALSEDRRRTVHLVDAAGLAEPLRALGFEVRTASSPPAGAALVVLGRTRIDAAEREALAASLAAGGALLCAATGWGWEQLNPGRTLARDLELNRLLSAYGLAFATGGVSADARLAGGGGAFASAPGLAGASSPAAHAGRALDLLERGRQSAAELAAARAALVGAAGAVPEEEPLLGARLARLAEERLALWRRGRSEPLSDDPRDSLAVVLWGRRWRDAAPADVPVAPGAEAFPGLVRAGARGAAAESRPRALTLAPGPAGWRGTGLWAPAGGVLRIEFEPGPAPPGAHVRIGSHSDSLLHLDRWRRWPELCLTRAVGEGGALELASPFGGLLYVELERPNAAPVALRVAGALAAPRLVAGDGPAEREAFTAALGALPAGARAPWVELEGRRVILTVPADAARACSDPLGVIAYWDAIWEQHAALLGAPLQAHPRGEEIVVRPERFVFDEQISAGWMHAGYPIMAHLVSAAAALDLVALGKEGDWGLFHELGHNAQDRAWTSSELVEVTCNLFTLHALERHVGIPVREHPRGGGLLPKLAAHRAAVAAGRAGFPALERDPFLALAPFVELQLAFGWEPFTRFFAEHRAVAADPAADPRSLGRPRGDQAVRDQWALRFSQLVERDLSGYLSSCGWPLSPTVAPALAHLAAWP